MENIQQIFDIAKYFNSQRAALEYAVRNSAHLSRKDAALLNEMICERFGVKIIKNTDKPTKTTQPKIDLEVEAQCLNTYGFYSEELLLDVDSKKGTVRIKSNLTNYKIIIKHLYPELKYSDFDGKPFIGDKPITHDDVLKISDRLTVFLKGLNVKIAEVSNALRLVSIENSFNPLAEYFTSLPTSNTNHLDNWLTTICGAEDTQLNRVLGRKWLISCVARAMKPGSYVEGSLIFVGKQGAGKTTFFRTINPRESYYCGSNVDISNTQKASQTYRGKFIVEFAELATIGKTTLEDTKQFLTETHDDYVPKYENLSVSVPRMMVFGGSTNKPDILVDTTGNRRFWCVKVSDNINIDLLKKIKEELWSEVYQAFVAGESWTLTPEEREMLNESNDEYQADNPIADVIREYLDSIEDSFVTSADVNRVATQFDRRATSRLVRSIMEDILGWKKIQQTSGKNKGCSIYKRPQTA